MVIYGIRNCNTVKAALDWLNKHRIDYEFHDYKSKGITEDKLRGWIEQVGWEPLVNRKGTTWRKLAEAERRAITDQSAAVRLMMEKNSVIKRPLLEEQGKVVALGFDMDEYQKKLK
jgi:Spx/MgsR family transcriptional regulator